ncbi:uncharacterized protein LOC119784756 isoform X2 [Cyprinodon tularosa]|uniref:uncharacterized protein LOC119784756 isoform X2 n=1 Tax=Cyprinodon tularosa TaxID=77115 RepID=UPI0018E25D9B|nr:uncharacterized protein LOC119784756 isoform X2 [Cyprinodon tularosa]
MMDPYRVSTPFCFIIVYLLGATRLSSCANCSCPKIPPKNFTLPKDGCFNSGDTYRYQCIQGYTNKAGTSTRIKCEEQDGVLNWSKPSLVCIPKPGYKPQPTTSQANCSCPEIPPKNFTLPKDGCFNSGDAYRYQCIPGYTNKAGTSTRIKCEEQDGVLNWSKPSLPSQDINHSQQPAKRNQTLNQLQQVLQKLPPTRVLEALLKLRTASPGRKHCESPSVYLWRSYLLS